MVELEDLRWSQGPRKAAIPKRPMTAEFILMMIELGFTYQSTIIWDKQRLSGHKSCLGYVYSPQKPQIRKMHSNIVVFSLGDWELSCATGESSLLEKSEYDELARSIWRVLAETRPYGSHPCPMALPIAENAVKIFSYEKDLVIDPFAGSATTAIACLRNNRRFLMIDLSQTYCAEAQQRIDQESKRLNIKTEHTDAA